MKRDYLSRLSRAARWYLPPAEAADVLEDYRDLIEEEPRSEEELRRDLGTPKDAVGQLVQLKAYHRWLIVFAVLTVCVVLPAACPICNRLFWWHDAYWFAQLVHVYLLVGVILSFLWFQRNGKREGRLPAGIAVVMLLLLAGIAWFVFLEISVVCAPEPFVQFGWEHPILFPVVDWSQMLGCPAMGLASLFGLVQARMRDRRWRAVYILGLTGTLVSLSVWVLLSTMNLDFSSTGWQMQVLLEFLSIILIGLVGTAVSLC